MKYPQTFDLTPEFERRRALTFGITEAIAGVITGLSGGLISGGLATGVAGGLEGAAGGALLSGIEGGNPLTGALTGGLTGGAIGGLGPAIGEATGLGTTVGDIAAGAGAGALGGAITGQSPLTGALTGGTVGLAAGLSAPSGTAATPPSAAITPASTATGASGAAGSAGSVGAASAAASSPIPLDPTAGAAGGGDLTLSDVPPFMRGGSLNMAPEGFTGAGSGGVGTAGPQNINVVTGGGGAAVDGADAMGLSGPGGFVLPTGDGGVSAPIGPATSGTFTFPAAGGTLGHIGSSIMGLIEKNPGLLLSGGLLGMNLLKGNEQYPAEKQLNTLATNAGTQGQALAGYINSGTLPPGAHEAVTSATNAAKATMRSRFAQMGLSGSSMEAQALGDIDRQAAAQTFQMADRLLMEGANYSQLAGQLYNNILQSQVATDRELQQSLMTFAGGLGGLRAGQGAA